MTLASPSLHNHSRIGNHPSNELQTEELVTDTRMVITPRQRVEQKLAACTGAAHTPDSTMTRMFNLRRPK